MVVWSVKECKIRVKKWVKTMFFGEYRHSIDDKGRLSIPSKMRSLCGEMVYVTRGNDGCLAMYTQEGWLNYYKELQALPQKKKDVRIYVRLITSRVRDCPFDKLGRINIPATLRDEANLKKECVVIGVGDHVEIWDEEKWNEYYNVNMDNFDEIAESLEDFDL